MGEAIVLLFEVMCRIRLSLVVVDWPRGSPPFEGGSLRTAAGSLGCILKRRLMVVLLVRLGGACFGGIILTGLLLTGEIR